MSEDRDGKDKKKTHRVSQSGVKAEKKRRNAKKDEIQTERVKQRNPKAFAINSVQRAERTFRRKEDITAKKQHIPVVDQTPDEPPPMLIGVVGPSKVGKTTLINNLIKNFTRTNVTDIRGPITIVTSKKQRITLLECNNDINSMIDVAKCVDLVLLMCDASYGFEMEVFEFLNICQVHGMPKIMGVLTHLDLIQNPTLLRKRKKELKHRFWTEVYDGAKLFYLSGLLHGEYLRNEIKNLGRFISVLKLRPLQWRGTHSYVLVDRVEDMTNTEVVRRNSKTDRDVIMYGYVRGVPLKKEHMVHIAGFGDARIDDLSMILDPCPLPGTGKKRSLLEKERLLYAPMSGVSGIVYDKDAVYVELQGSYKHRENSAVIVEQEKLLGKLIEKKQTVDDQIKEQEFKIFSDGLPIKSWHFMDENKNESLSIENDEEITDDRYAKESETNVSTNDHFDLESDELFDDCSESSDDEEYQNVDVDDTKMQNGLVNYSHGSDNDEDDNDEASNANTSMIWKENLAQKAHDAYLQRYSESRNLMRQVYICYGQNKKEENVETEKDSSDSEELGSLFKVVSKGQSDRDIRKKEEVCGFQNISGKTRNWLEDHNKELINNCFVTGKWKASEDAENLLKIDSISDEDSEVYGDFEDLETGEKYEGDLQTPTPKEEHCDEYIQNKSDFQNVKLKRTRVEEANLTKAELTIKKRKLKEKFDAEYDDKEIKKDTDRIEGDHDFYKSLKDAAQKQSELNKKEFEGLDKELRVEIEGFRAGFYVRLGFKNIPSEFIEHFDPTYPILIGGLNMSEENIGYVNCKVKKHRWYKKILKTGDPLIISIGWRRFQTIPMYAKVEDNFRFRYLKYTPNHVTCSMTFWGPITPQNTGFLALQSVHHDLKEIKNIGFRIAATGCVTELDNSTQIMKKLKLVGHPFKIYQKTAFIKDMFNSTLEVAKFEGGKIKTVSGIRGQIKKAHHTPEGSFRATFEDKIQLSDIVFCRTWFRVDVPRFYAPVSSLLLPCDKKCQWQGMKTLGQLKRERQIKNEVQYDSLYTEIKREPKIFKPLVIPKALQRSLPYKDKPKMSAHMDNDAEKNRVAIVQSPHEQRIAKLMKMLEINYRDKRSNDKNNTKLRMKKFRAEKQAENVNKLKRQKELRRKISRALSKQRNKELT